jgi:hypothetical protein
MVEKLGESSSAKADLSRSLATRARQALSATSLSPGVARLVMLDIIQARTLLVGVYTGRHLIWITVIQNKIRAV